MFSFTISRLFLAWDKCNCCLKCWVFASATCTSCTMSHLWGSMQSACPGTPLGHFSDPVCLLRQSQLPSEKMDGFQSKPLERGIFTAILLRMLFQIDTNVFCQPTIIDDISLVHLYIMLTVGHFGSFFYYF